MASVAERPDGTWRARYRDERGREHSRHFPRKRDAREWLDGVTARRVTGMYTDPKLGRITVGEWSGHWGRDHLKPSTALRYEGLLRNQVLPVWGPVRVVDVTHVGVQGWVSDLTRSGLSASSVRAAHRVLSLMLDLAVRDRRIPVNPATGVRLPRAVRPEPRFLNRREVELLADEAGTDGDVIRFLALTGLRFGEMAGLRVRRVDLLRRRVTVAENLTQVGGKLVPGTPKTHQSRTVPVPRSLVDDLTLRCAGKGPDEHVFTSPLGGPVRLDNWRRRAFDPAVAAAGLEHLTPHDLRHTAASLAVSAGANVKAVQRMLGHASAAMTLDRYAGLFDDDLDAVADRMDDAAADQVRTVAPVSLLTERHQGL